MNLMDRTGVPEGLEDPEVLVDPEDPDVDLHLSKICPQSDCYLVVYLEDSGEEFHHPDLQTEDLHLLEE